MNTLTETIMSRRSIRKYKQEQVSEETMQAIIKAGIYAPNGGNSQQWHFTVIQNADILKSLNEQIKKAMINMQDLLNPYLKANLSLVKSGRYCFYYGAPSVILISSSKTNFNNIADCACAAQNIQLAAHAEGVGSVYVNQPTRFGEDPDVRALLTEIGVPEDYHVGASVALGYADSAPRAAVRKEDVVNYVK